jgi:uncharacterized protein YndB with AHSA1/START domain
MVANNAASPAAVDEREIIGTRVFDAPRELVWTVWTDPKHIAQWWGPRGFRNTIHEMDVRPGGTWRFIMHGPDGQDYQNKIVYVEIVKPERIVYDHVSGPTFRATATFEDLGGKTRVTLRTQFETAALRKKVAEEYGAVEGMQQTLDRLGEHLKRTTGEEFVIERAFDAPRDLMWRVWTDPEHMKHWFGPKGVTVVHSDNDFRVGGTYHYAMKTPDGTVMWGQWVYREITPPERMVFVSSFSDKDRGLTRHPLAPEWPLELLSTIEFAERDGKAVVVVHWTPINATDAEWSTFKGGQASMNQGWSGTFEQLENYLRRMA